MRTFVGACNSCFLILIAQFLVNSFCANSAHGQGTMGMVPDPISSRELSRYAQRLGLSDHQLQAVQTMHDYYRESYRVLRGGDIEELLSAGRGVGASMSMMLDRKALEVTVSNYESILSKIKSLDNQLFDQLQTVLSDNQLAGMQQVRQARERARYQTGMTRMARFINPASRVDLYEILSDIVLTPEEREGILPLLNQYESTLTSETRKLHEAAVTMPLEIAERMHELGLTDEAFNNPETRSKRWEIIRNIWGEMNKKIAEQAFHISELNNKTVRSLSAVMSNEQASKLRTIFLTEGYREAMSGTSELHRPFEIAGTFDELNDEQRETIAALIMDQQSRIDRITDDMVKLIDERRMTQPMFSFDTDDQEEYEENLEALRAKRRDVNASVLQALYAVLGPDLSARLDKRLAKSDGDDEEEGPTRVYAVRGPGGEFGAFIARGNSTDDENNEDSIPVIDQYIPPAISARDLEKYANILSLPEDSLTILESLHRDYRDEFSALEKTGDIHDLKKANRQLWSMNPETESFEPPTPEDIDNVYQLRKRALANIQTLDLSFFDNVELALASGEQHKAAMKRVRLARECDVYNRGTSGSLFGIGGPQIRGRGRGPMRFMSQNESQESQIDLASQIDSLDVKPDNSEQFDAALLEYEQSAVAAFKSLFESSMEFQKERDKMMINAMQVDGTETRRRVRIEGISRDMIADQQRAHEKANRAVQSLNRESIEKLNAFLSNVDSQKLRDAYNRRAFPGVFEDPDSVEPHMTAALKLTDLSPQQKTQVEEIAIEYRSAYHDFCEKMIDVQSKSDGGSFASGRDWQAFGERMRSLETIRFERDDLNNKTLIKLRAVLNDQQIERLGGLQPKEPIDDFGF